MRRCYSVIWKHPKVKKIIEGLLSKGSVKMKYRNGEM